MGKKVEIVLDKDMSAVQATLIASPGLTRAKADILVKSGEVRADGLRLHANAQLKAGTTVKVFLPDALYDSPAPTVVYEDKNIVVFDKAKRTPYDSLPKLFGSSLFAVHRLDTNTTGLIVFAKTKSAADELEKAFKERRAVKIYEAIVSPPPKKKSDTLVAYTAMNDGVATVSAVEKDGYKQMVTEYETVKSDGEKALLRVYPHTGRTHQIRAHLKFIGSPIMGDPKYGGGQSVENRAEGQMLAAVELTFGGLNGELSYLNGKRFEAKYRLCGVFDGI